VIPRIRGQLHPLAALYRVDAVLDPIDGLLATDRLRLLDLMDLVRTRVLGEESFAAVDPELRTVHNLNSPAEYEAALDALARAEGT
jgi:molybdopterin-guanine dinucleotide biosynthesis protein A